MPDNWETYKDWKENLNESKNNRRDDDYGLLDDDVEDLTELFREYVD